MVRAHGGGSWWCVMGYKPNRCLGGLADGPDHGDVEEGEEEDGQQEEHQERDLVHGVPLKVQMYFTGYHCTWRCTTRGTTAGVDVLLI